MTPPTNLIEEALEPFSSLGELIELETTGFDDQDELCVVTPLQNREGGEG